MTCKKMPVVLAGLLVGFLLSVSPLYAGTIFQSFTNNSFNTQYFFLQMSGTPGTPTVAVTSNRLELTVPATTSSTSPPAAAGLEPYDIYNLTGDYDIQVDFNLLNWPTPNGVQAGIITPQYEVDRVYYDWQGNQDAYFVYFFAETVPGQPNWGHVVPTSDNSGKLRLNRIGNTVSGYYWQNNAWQPIASNTDPQNGGPISFYIGGYAGNRSIGQDTKIAFDNLKVTNGVFPSSLPPLNLLLGN
ncbi:MAG TPA: hypothetical protein VIN67_02765 [Desulfobaccales bacterium]